jgi:hypothetical protein
MTNSNSVHASKEINSNKIIKIWKMLNSALGAIVKHINKEILS